MKNIIKKKTLFLKSNKIGDGELGAMLIEGFLNAVSMQEKIPENIILVNSAVLLLTQKKKEKIVTIFKNLENCGTKIYLCGTCLDYYKSKDKLKAGIVSNGVEILNILLNTKVVSL